MGNIPLERARCPMCPDHKLVWLTGHGFTGGAFFYGSCGHTFGVSSAFGRDVDWESENRYIDVLTEQSEKGQTGQSALASCLSQT